MYATFLAKYYPNVASAMIVAIRMHARALSHKIIIKCSAQFKSLFLLYVVAAVVVVVPTRYYSIGSTSGGGGSYCRFSSMSISSERSTTPRIDAAAVG